MRILAELECQKRREEKDEDDFSPNRADRVPFSVFSLCQPTRIAPRASYRLLYRARTILPLENMYKHKDTNEDFFFSFFCKRLDLKIKNIIYY